MSGFIIRSVPEICKDLLACYRFETLRPDKLAGVFGHNASDFCPRGGKSAGKTDRFVGGYSAGDSKKDCCTVKF